MTLLRPKYARRSLEERFNVTRWTPPSEARSAAKERTLDLVMAYLYDGARYDGLFIMAESCYLQGVNDAAEALLKTGHKIVKEEE